MQTEVQTDQRPGQPVNQPIDQTAGQLADQGAQLEAYCVRLPAFEGPMDLLLHLIKKDEINIYDIPIALITQNYLECLDLMKSLNLNIAGEFLVMAATLIYIKSKTLLPVEETAGEELEEDPRLDLVHRLLEYQRFKEAAEQFKQREEIWREVFRREGDGGSEGEVEIRLVDISLFDLMGALQAVFSRIPETKVIEIMPDELSVRERMGRILERLEQSEKMLPFESIFEEERTRGAVIVTLLALLELIRLRLVGVQQFRVYETIWISKAVQEEEGP